MSDLDAINDSLAAHFAGLREARAPHQYPIYAIEHPFDAVAIASLKQALSDRLRQQRTLEQSHWLCWTVVAAEIGYTFDGDEYWDTFGEELSTWQSYGGDRRQIRRWFRSFAKQFGGYHPSGRWASHFSIIAWPITHAVLPQDLQQDFARLVYELRAELAERAQAGVTTIGEILRASGRHARSSRFEVFLEQTDLTGQLVLALRDEDVQTDVPRLWPATMERLVSDVGRTQNARDWLRETRKVLRDARSRVASGLTPRSHGQVQSPTERSVGRCSIIAQQTPDGGWRLFVTLPDFASISSFLNIDLRREEGTVSFLDETTQLPLRSLLGLSKRQRPLTQLTSDPREVLRVHAEPSWSVQLSQSCQLIGGPRWLLRVQSDGVARQVLGHHVRAGEDYLLACADSVDGKLETRLGLARVNTETRGIKLYSLSVPRHFSTDFDSALVAFGLGRVHSTVIEPVGLVPRYDGDAGRTTWLASEEPILSLHADSVSSEFVVAIDGEQPSRFQSNSSSPTLIGLGRLPLGRHRVSVTTVVNAAHAEEVSQAEEIEIEVRSPTSWLHADARALGFRVALEPENARIEELVSGEAFVSVIAPPGRKAAFAANTYSVRGQLREHFDLGSINLPASQNAIKQKIARLGQEPASEEIHASARVEITITLEELGMQSLVFPRKVKPLRWVVQRNGASRTVRLINDHGDDTEIEVMRYNIDRPDRKISLTVDDCLAGILLEPHGALFSAHLNGQAYRAAICVSHTALNALANLGVVVRVDSELATPKKIPRLLALRRLWSGASWQGQLVSHRKSQVLGELDDALVTAACGSPWGTRYALYRRDPEADLSVLQQEVGGSPGFASRMRNTNFLHSIGGMAPVDAFIEWAKRYGISDDPGLAKFAFTLAFRPTDLRFDDPTARAAVLTDLANHPALARGAFLAKLASERSEKQEAAA